MGVVGEYWVAGSGREEKGEVSDRETGQGGAEDGSRAGTSVVQRHRAVGVDLRPPSTGQALEVVAP